MSSPEQVLISAINMLHSIGWRPPLQAQDGPIYELALQIEALKNGGELTYKGAKVERSGGMWIVRTAQSSAAVRTAAAAAEKVIKLVGKDAWEEQAHPRAGEGQQVGNSKGGQFVAKGASGGAAKPEEAPKGVGVATMLKAKEMAEAFNKRMNAPGFIPRKPEYAAQWFDRHYRDASPELKREAVAQFNERFVGKEEAKPEEKAGEGDWRKEAGEAVALVKLYRGGADTAGIAKELNLSYDDVRKKLRAVGVYKEYGRHGVGKFFKAINLPPKVKGQPVAKALLRWMQDNPQGGNVVQIAKALLAQHVELGGGVALGRAITGYFKDWERKGWVQKISGQAPQVTEVQPELSQQSFSKIEEHLRTGVVSKIATQRGGGGNARRVTFNDGTQAIFKLPENRGELRREIEQGYDTEREVGAWEVAKLVGMQDLVTPVIERTLDIDGKKVRGPLLNFQAGEVAHEVGGARQWDSAQDLERTAVFDFVVGNEDRHPGNWMISPDNKLRLIDHGLTFPEKPWASYNAYMFKNLQAVERGERLYNFPVKQADSPRSFAQPYVENKEKIVATLQKVGLKKAAIDGVVARIDALAKTNRWTGLPDARG